MVQMLLSGKEVFHASQWLGTITGLMIGAMTALSALVFGQHVALGLFQWNQKRAATNHKPSLPQSEETRPRCPVILTVTVVTLFLLLSSGALYGVLSENGAGFWRRFCASVLLAPIGALLRWQLSALNPSDDLCRWFPRGTFIANMLACAISFLSQGIDTRWNSIHPRYIVLLVALRTGLAGSLSTVSTWVVEARKNSLLLPVVTKGDFVDVDSEAHEWNGVSQSCLCVSYCESRSGFGDGNCDLWTLHLVISIGVVIGVARL